MFTIDLSTPDANDLVFQSFSNPHGVRTTPIWPTFFFLRHLRHSYLTKYDRMIECAHEKQEKQEHITTVNDSLPTPKINSLQNTDSLPTPWTHSQHQKPTHFQHKKQFSAPRASRFFRFPIGTEASLLETHHKQTLHGKWSTLRKPSRNNTSSLIHVPVGWGGVGWDDNVHVPMHTPCTATSSAFLLLSRDRHSSFMISYRWGGGS